MQKLLENKRWSIFRGTSSDIPNSLRPHSPIKIFEGRITHRVVPRTRRKKDGKGWFRKKKRDRTISRRAERGFPSELANIFVREPEVRVIQLEKVYSTCTTRANSRRIISGKRKINNTYESFRKLQIRIIFHLDYFFYT